MGLPSGGGSLGVLELFAAAVVAVFVDQLAGAGEGGAVTEDAGAVEVDVGEEQGHRSAAGDGLGFVEVGGGALGVVLGMVEQGASEQAEGASAATQR